MGQQRKTRVSQIQLGLNPSSNDHQNKSGSSGSNPLAKAARVRQVRLGLNLTTGMSLVFQVRIRLAVRSTSSFKRFRVNASTHSTLGDVDILRDIWDSPVVCARPIPIASFIDS